MGLFDQFCSNLTRVDEFGWAFLMNIAALRLSISLKIAVLNPQASQTTG